MRVIAKISFLFLTTWGMGFILFLAAIPREAKESQTAEAAIVLTGGSKRIEEGIALVNGHYVNKLFITGVNFKIHNKETLPVLQEVNELDNAEIGNQATSTRGNALEAQEWIKQNNVHSILLVTANYHMPRSMLEFKSKIHNVVIKSHPVFPEGFDVDEWWLDKHSAFLVLSEYSKFLYVLTLVILHQN